MSHVFYTILGLGDSNYSKYQGAPRYLDEALQKLGATRFYERGEADEATSLELVVEPWIEGALKAVEKQNAKLKNLKSDEISHLLTPVVVIDKQSTEPEKRVQEHLTTWGKITGGKVLVEEDDRIVLELEFLTEKEVSRELIDVGSSFSVYP